jgi:hypothetical protein
MSNDKIHRHGNHPNSEKPAGAEVRQMPVAAQNRICPLPFMSFRPTIVETPNGAPPRDFPVMACIGKACMLALQGPNDMLLCGLGAATPFVLSTQLVPEFAKLGPALAEAMVRPLLTPNEGGKLPLLVLVESAAEIMGKSVAQNISQTLAPMLAEMIGEVLHEVLYEDDPEEPAAAGAAGDDGAPGIRPPQIAALSSLKPASAEE